MSPRQPLVLRRLCGSACFAAALSQAIYAQTPSQPARVEGNTGTRIRVMLREELMDHWYPHAVEKTRGGFHQNLARDWSYRPDEGASLVYQSRMTWTAAAYAQ